ncbi:MAG: hypothetical protein JXR77_06705 [Lentisphaeria bacterium]|nr:hypothetical protein [Lentisphaeria bacterium]
MPQDPMPSPDAPEPVRERFFRAAAVAYLALLPFDVALLGPLRAHDLLAPIFLAAVCRRGDFRRYLRLPDGLLVGFLALAAIATVCHLDGWNDVYELMVMGYTALLYVFFSRTLLAPSLLGGYGLAVGALCWATALLQVATGGFRSHAAYEGTVLGFLALRFQLFFPNPNQCASFLALPVVCALLALPSDRGRTEGWTPGSARARLAAAAGLLAPLLLTASRHVLLAAAPVLGCASLRLPGRPRLLRAGAWGLLAAGSLLLLLTVLFPFFPLQSRFPFFNRRTAGMYTIHHMAYLRLTCLDPAAFLLGVGRSNARTLYSTLVDSAAARRILAEYRMDGQVEGFTGYMDAHNEYLNTATTFGVPATILLYGFLLAWARQRRRRCPGRVGTMACFFLAAVMVACLWDDLLSKRWIWVILGVLTAAGEGDVAASRPQTS